MKNNSDPQTNNSNQNYSEELLSIPTKICDGIFMADELIAQDIEWLQMNQVTHIINCAGKHTKNTTKMNGVSFLTYQWSENNIQNIIEQNVIGASISFIEQAKKQCGSVLVHCHQSQSRPFCILASYLMIRYQWNLFKTLQFLNSRKQDIELEPAFFQQLTSLHQKLQEKGLIKSRTWSRDQNMSDQQIVLTNTFLNSRKKLPDNNNETSKAEKKSKKTSGKPKKINWKDEMSQIHSYYPQTALIQLNPKVPPANENKQPPKVPKQRQQNITAKYFQETNDKNNLKAENNSMSRQNVKQSKAISEVNVTKKWAQLRQTWTKQKQNNQFLPNQNQTKITCIFLLQF